MRNLFLALLLAMGVVTAQETTVNEITPSGVITQTVVEEQEEPSLWVNDTLKPYVAVFLAIMKKDGWDIDRLREYDIFVIFDYDLGQQGIDRMSGKAGIALGMDNDELVYVVINMSAWVDLDEWDKQDLINHELMHDIFNVRHTAKDDRSRLMHPSSYPRSYGDMMIRLFGAIKDLNIAEGYE